MLIKELTGARCGQPFEQLGWTAHPEGGLLLRAWLPGARQVEAQTLAGDALIGKLVMVKVTRAMSPHLVEGELMEVLG